MTELLPLKAKRRIWSLRRRDGPKSRKLHLGEYVAKSARLPSEPPYKKARFQRAALEPFGTPFSPIFRRATKDGVPEGRRSSTAPRKNAKHKNMAPGGPTETRMPVKTQNKKTTPPEGLPKRESR